MKEQTEQKIREYLEQFRIQFTGEEKPGSSATLAELVLDGDSSDPVSEEILTNICNIIGAGENQPTVFTERKQIIDAIKAKKELLKEILKENQDELYQLKLQNAMFCDEKQWYVESEEDVVITKRPKKVIKDKIGRVHWKENFMGESTGDVIEIERKRIIFKNGIFYLNSIL